MTNELPNDEEDRIKRQIELQNPDFIVVDFVKPQNKLIHRSSIDSISNTLSEIQTKLRSDPILVNRFSGLIAPMAKYQVTEGVLLDIQIAVRKRDEENDRLYYWWYSKAKQAVVAKQLSF
jgi:hypothetical protein